MRITKLTTSASTGRRINRSVKLLHVDLLVSRTHRVRGLWVQLRLWRKIVVDRHRHSVAQLEDAGADDCFPRFQTRRDRNKIAARFADANKLLPDRLRFLAGLFILLSFDHINRIAVRAHTKRHCRDDERALFFRQHNFDLRQTSLVAARGPDFPRSPAE